MFNIAGQYIGNAGVWDGLGETPIFRFSNEVLVGPSRPEDAEFFFTEEFPSGGQFVADAGEEVFVNFPEDRHYDLYFIAIRELRNGQLRDGIWGSWEEGQQATFSLDLRWDEKGKGVLNAGDSYAISFATENRACRNAIEWQQTSTWNNNTEEIFICPAGTGCLRLGFEKSVKVYPNPAAEYLTIEGIPAPGIGEYRVVLNDMLGRRVLDRQFTGEPLSLNTIPAGAYVLQLYNGVDILRSQRLQIVR